MAKVFPFALALAAVIHLAGPAGAACPSPLVNGTTANATLVMDWFDCKASLDGATFSGSLLVDRPGGNQFTGRYNASNPRAGIYTLGTAGLSVFGANLNYNSGNRLDYDKTGAGVLLGDIGDGNFGIWVASGTAGNDTGFGNSLASRRLAITPSGSVLINTLADGGWAGSALFESDAPAGKYGVSAYHYGGGSNGGAMLVRVDSSATRLVDWYYSTTNTGSVTTDGTNTNYNTTSDARLKSNVSDLSAGKALRALRAYRPQEYLIRGRPGFGALAQDVDRRMDAAGIDAASLGIVTRGDGNRALKEGQPGFRQWGMDSAKMMPFVISAVLDHEESIRTLVVENAELKRQLRALARTVASGERRKSFQTASN